MQILRMAYIQRTIEPLIQRALQEFPALALMGPRRCGKTTVLQHLLRDKYTYISFDGLDRQLAASQDPRGFLDLYAPPVIMDEVQHVPELFSYIKERIDSQPDKKGQYVLTGSQNFFFSKRVEESLAGRVAILNLLPLAAREIQHNANALLPWQRDSLVPSTDNIVTGLDFWQSLIIGGYPDLQQDPSRSVSLWYSSYLQTYLERDVRSLAQIGDLRSFQIFLQILATLTGQILNISAVSRKVGVAVNTIKSWLSILEATYQVFFLHPYSGNQGKRLTKAPKIYMGDTGIVCSLMGLKDPEHVMKGPMRGALMETAVVIEVMRSLTHQGEKPMLYFWRGPSGQEVDIIVDIGTEIIPIEVKGSATPHPRMAQGIRSFMAAYPQKVQRGYVIHSGSEFLPLGDSVTAVPFGAL